jgi:hypothetical protein
MANLELEKGGGVMWRKPTAKKVILCAEVTAYAQSK